MARRTTRTEISSKLLMDLHEVPWFSDRNGKLPDTAKSYPFLSVAKICSMGHEEVARTLIKTVGNRRWLNGCWDLQDDKAHITLSFDSMEEEPLVPLGERQPVEIAGFVSKMQDKTYIMNVTFCNELQDEDVTTLKKYFESMDKLFWSCR